MIFNYEAFTHPEGECFRFPAKDDDDARRIIEDYLQESGQFRASIYRWKDDSDEAGSSMYEHSNEIKVEVPEKARKQTVEYKIETRYIKYIECSGVTGEEAFRKAAQVTAETCDTLPEHPGWEKRYRAELVWHTDDERRGAQVEHRDISKDKILALGA